jgi:hypothetical protein
MPTRSSSEWFVTRAVNVTASPPVSAREFRRNDYPAAATVSNIGIKLFSL